MKLQKKMLVYASLWGNKLTEKEMSLTLASGEALFVVSNASICRKI
jgi:hypothetical protein